MKLGITPWLGGERTAAALTEQASQAEALGYESFWLPESHFNPGAIPDPLMLLAAVAAGTSSIRLATTSYLLPLRHPIQAAEQVAVLDQLSRGRVLLGVGRGYAAPMLAAFDIEARHKRSLFEACLGRMIEAWSGAPLADGLVLDPLPVQKPHPPVWVAAFGPKALDQAGRLGLPYLASPMEPLETLLDNLRRHRAAAAGAGRQLEPVVPVMRSVFVTESATETVALREALAAQARALPGRPVPADVDDWAIVGEPGAVRERVAEYRERLGMTHLIVARPRLGELPTARLTRSVAAAAELLSGS